MIVVDKRVNDIINLYDFRCRSFYKDLVAAGYNLTLWERCSEGVNGFVFYSQEINHGNIFKCDYFFDQT